MLTDEQQRSRERIAADAIMARHPDLFQCRGWPEDHYCIVLLPAGSGRTLCHSCDRARAADLSHLRASTPFLPSVGDVLKDLPPFEVVEACECGGDRNGYMHEQSLLHVTWMKGRPFGVEPKHG